MGAVEITWYSLELGGGFLLIAKFKDVEALENQAKKWRRDDLCSYWTNFHGDPNCTVIKEGEFLNRGEVLRRRAIRIMGDLLEIVPEILQWLHKCESWLVAIGRTFSNSSPIDSRSKWNNEISKNFHLLTHGRHSGNGLLYEQWKNNRRNTIPRHVIICSIKLVEMYFNEIVLLSTLKTEYRMFLSSFPWFSVSRWQLPLEHSCNNLSGKSVIPGATRFDGLTHVFLDRTVYIIHDLLLKNKLLSISRNTYR